MGGGKGASCGGLLKQALRDEGVWVAGPEWEVRQADGRAGDPSRARVGRRWRRAQRRAVCQVAVGNGPGTAPAKGSEVANGKATAARRFSSSTAFTFKSLLLLVQLLAAAAGLRPDDVGYHRLRCSGATELQAAGASLHRCYRPCPTRGRIPHTLCLPMQLAELCLPMQPPQLWRPSRETVILPASDTPRTGCEVARGQLSMDEAGCRTGASSPLVARHSPTQEAFKLP